MPKLCDIHASSMRLRHVMLLVWGYF